MPLDRPLQQTQETIRMPLYDYDSGVSNYTGAPTTSPAGAEQAYLNLIPCKKKSSLTGETIVTLEKRQGLALVHDIDAKAGQAGSIYSRALIGMSQCDDVLVYACARDNGGTITIEIYQLRPSANTAVVIGTISTVAGPPAVTVSTSTDVYLTEIKIGNLPGVAVVITNYSGASGTSAGYYALTSSGVFGAATLTKISDADFPTNQATYVHIVGPMQQMNQITYVMASDGRIYNSNTDSIGTWSALGFLEAEAYPDKGVGLLRYKHHIVAFNQSSIEFFNDVGNDPTLGSPLERTEQAFIKFGAIYGKSIINIDDILYWVAASANNTMGVWKLEGYAPVEISTPAIAADLTFGGNLKNRFVMTQFLSNDRSHLSISGSGLRVGSVTDNYASITTVTNEPTWGLLDTSATSMCYNIKDGMWWHFGLPDGESAKMYAASIPSSANIRDTYTTYVVFGDSGLTSTFYTLYQIRASAVGVYQDWSVDDGAYGYYAFAYQSAVNHFGTEKRKFLHRFKIIEDHPNFSTDTNPNHIKLMLSRVGFSLAEAIPQIRTSALQAYASGVKRLFWQNFGAIRSLQFCIFGKTKDPFSFIFTEIDISQGTS